MKLDAIDRKILGVLRGNGRIPNNELAAAVGLSASACLRRVRLLEQAGVILGYTAVVAEPEVAGALTAIVRITLEKQTEDYLNRFEAAVRRHPEIVECFLMTGDEDYILRTVADSPAAYEVIHKEILSRLPGVVRINSSLAIRSVLAT
ncbi:Lrp/AsnC family transcriptional regulator [Pedomonas mirosovicensis]|uniref:Lrp/AsnC family transcriptional regulator n=1 Tax=Pedomonas mirosovicensis TaxID=2908641 RepID=UPI0021673DD7|nr:Lrp/AsnC family transcriptional regulator [Pedomonas mirosovicensis]MCH8686665.1 Lrp/AsnC family transcriptional regulator [Pedomonas mirosovicensis]